MSPMTTKPPRTPTGIAQTGVPIVDGYCCCCWSLSRSLSVFVECVLWRDGEMRGPEAEILGVYAVSYRCMYLGESLR